jgi:hypothetical protein
VDAEPGTENEVESPARPDQQGPDSDTSTTENGPSVAEVETAVDPEPSKQPLTRRYPDVSDDDRDLGWGERPASSGRDDDWYLRERPPHHG